MNRKRTKILKVRFSRKGVTAALIFVAALALFITALGISFVSYGQGTWRVAILALISFLLFAAGLSLAAGDILERPKEDAKPLISKIAVGLNIAGMLGIIAVYIYGSLN